MGAGQWPGQSQAMRRRAAPTLSHGLMLLALCVSAPAVSAPDPAKLKAASESFEAGARAFENNRFEEAAAHFEAADAAAPSAKALRLAIKARGKASQGARAATLAALATQRYPDDAETKKVAAQALDEHASKLHRAEVSCVSPCLLAVGSRIVHGEASTRWVVYLDPGKTSIGASFLGKIAATDQSLVAVPGGTSNVRFSPAKSADGGGEGGAGGGPAVTTGGSDATGGGGAGGEAGGGGEQAEPASDWRIHPAPFFVGLAATVGLGATTIWSGIDTMNDPGADRVREECAGQGEDCQLYQDGQAKELRTNALIGATAGAGAITLILGIVAKWSSETPEDEATPAAFQLDPPTVFVGGARPDQPTEVVLRLGGRF